ncbi:MAG: hypothetical protein FD137_2652, partial [Spirochaetes bacterium]
MVLYARKLGGYGKKAALVKDLSWAGDTWIPPKLFSGTYQVKGKVAENLHPIQVALLLELPLARVVALILEGLKSQGIAEVLTEDPLRIRILTAEQAEEALEEAFLACFDAEGRVLSGLLMDFFEAQLKELQERLWDCDIEATKAHYRAKLADGEMIEAEAQGDRARYAAWRASNPHWHYWHGYHYVRRYPDRYAALGLPGELKTGYAEFMRSSSCFSGCFSPEGAGTSGAC